MRTRAAVISAFLLALPASAAAVQTPGNINLSSLCFDSLPYGVEHTCEVVIPNLTKAGLGSLYTAVARLAAADSLVIARRDSGDKGVAIIADRQPAPNPCLDTTLGRVPISATVALHFDATPRNRREAGYVVIVRSTAVSVEGNTGTATSMAMCYAMRYMMALDSLPDRNGDD